MYELKKFGKVFRVNLLGPGPRLTKKNLPGRGLTKFEKHCFKGKGHPGTVHEGPEGK